MNIETRGKGIDISNELLTHVERRMYFSLGRFIDQIEKIEILLADVNGPRGGIDKSCRITVQLKGLHKIRNEQKYSEIKGAVNLSADRIALTVARRLDKAVTLIHRTKSQKIPEDELEDENSEF